jgi:hypothetical protein
LNYLNIEKYNKVFKGKTQHFISKKEDKKGRERVKEVFLNAFGKKIKSIKKIFKAKYLC